MDARELGPGLWRWTTAHPDWTPEEGGPDGWEPEVGCLYYEASDTVVLIDPLVPPGEPERSWGALDRDIERAGSPVAVLLTIYWHERSAGEVAERYDGTIWAFERGVERLQLRPTNLFRAGDPLPGGVQAIDAVGKNEALFWLPDRRALVPGDVLLGNGEGGVRLCPESWLLPGFGHERLRASLRHLLDLPVDLLLLSHGEPVLESAREALARALHA